MDDSRSVNAVARDRALAMLTDQPVHSTALVEYSSNGKVIVIGDEMAMELAPRMREHDLKVEVLLTSGSVQQGETVIPVGGRSIRVSGYMGEFKVAIGTPGSATYEELQSDLILDLGRPPQLTVAIKPPGYFIADSTDESVFLETLEELKALRGTFEKPRFFDYDPNICAHASAGQTGCTACLDTCPADAITSLTEAIEVNPHLCQGGGICTSVCPTGAIRYVYPSLADTLKQIQQVLTQYRFAGGDRAIIAFISHEDHIKVEQWPDNIIPIVLEELASVGLDVWSSTLAFGASSILLLDSGSVPDEVNSAIKGQLGVLKKLLSGMGYPADVIDYRSTSALHTGDSVAIMPRITPINPRVSINKREVMFNAIDHLASESSGVMEEEIALPKPAPFGQVKLSTDKCTLCMSCTSVCPPQALQAGNDVPRLSFLEESCVQCGLCEGACPEQAIEIAPRMLTDHRQRRANVVLKEEIPFLCVSCDKPFATRSMIDTILGKLSGHAMFQSERAKQRLMMCEDCRVVDVVQDSQAMEDQALQSTIRKH